MESFLRHMILALGLVGAVQSAAQNVPWIAPTASLNTVPLNINCIPQADGQPLAEGDYIGVFNEQGRCFGLGRWKDTINYKITVVGSDGVTDGFNTGDKLILKLWLRDENCVLEKISQVSADNPLIYANSAANRVNILNFQRLSVSYLSETFCLNAGIILPQLNYPTDDLTFTTAQDLDLDTATGAVNPLASNPGTYSINLNSGTCLSGSNLSLMLHDFPRLSALPDTFICGERPLRISLSGDYNTVQWSTGASNNQVEISSPAVVWYKVTNDNACSNSDTFDIKKMDIASLTYTAEKADCYQKGRISITEQMITHGKPPYNLRLLNQLDSSEQVDLMHISEGIYALEIVNSNGCVLRYNKKLVIEKDCLNDKPVFSPNDDGLDDRYFLNLEGRLEIFDRNGQRKRQLLGPCYFDGNDEAGNPLPMGVYMVVSEKRETVELTIIR